ncbi:MAG TPA: 30S ribosomal protein S12 methylthiotransferase RimO [Candidatus Kapabacteria bacterium]|nr:30S ribosomal protein S12 methylthiotransferase RimO [Candidatus Kapabacteria bacterium]
MSKVSTGKVAVVTLGCEKNTVDSEVIGGMLARRGVRMEEDAERAETVIINTCGFIDHAKKESIGAILEALELKKQGVVRKVYVAGCLSERYRSELEMELPEVDRFFGTQDFESILSSIIPDATFDFKHNLLGERQPSTPRHFAYLKISEGCDHPCSFCAIPIMRGGHRSRAIEELEFEAMMLASNGVKELVLIAQDSTNYGLDLYGERTLATLAARLARINGLEWIRIMYAYPAKFPLDLLDVMASEEKIIPYLDMPVQHASTEVLKSMRRGITRRATEELIANIRARVPGIALRTTLITGYPTEGEREFEELEEFVRTMQFDRLGVFTYSQEEGTMAHPLGDPIPQAVKLERQALLYDIQSEISLAKNLAKIGSIERVLIEREEIEGDDLTPTPLPAGRGALNPLLPAGRRGQGDEACYYGRTYAHAPEVDGEVHLYSDRELAIGDFVFARITGADEYDLEAEVIR